MLYFVLLGFSAVVLYLCVLIRKKNKKIEKMCNQLSELEKWHEIAYVDALTKIPNRAAYLKHMEHLYKKRGFEKYPVGVVLFDIDNFKNINDAFGHMEGDRILQRTAEILNEVFCDSHYSLYRIGGDEFAIISENLTEQQIIEDLLHLRNLEKLSENICLSKGYAMVKGKESFSSAFARADEMLYADKASRK